MVNDITTGTDGYLYFTAGDRGCRVMGIDERRVLPEETGGLFRCAQDGAVLELLGSGLRSPTGIVVDMLGRDGVSSPKL